MVFMVLSSWARKLAQAQPPSAWELLLGGKLRRERSPNISVWLVPSVISLKAVVLFM